MAAALGASDGCGAHLAGVMTQAGSSCTLNIHSSNWPPRPSRRSAARGRVLGPLGRHRFHADRAERQFSKGHGGMQCEACHGATHGVRTPTPTSSALRARAMPARCVNARCATRWHGCDLRRAIQGRAGHSEALAPKAGQGPMAGVNLPTRQSIRPSPGSEPTPHCRTSAVPDQRSQG